MKSFSYSLLFVCFLCTTMVSLAQTSEPVVKVSGEVGKPLTLTGTVLSGMKRVTVTLKDRGGENHQYTGVPLQAILDSAGVTTGQKLKGENLAKYLLVKCADGYEVLFSLAELDSSFTDRVVILADRIDNKPLPMDKGPYRLVVPGEKKPARSCMQVTEMLVRFAKE